MKTIHVVSNSHIDPVWLWNKYEGIDEVINTFSSVCDRLDENPDLKFSGSSISFYKWVLDYSPELFEKIKKHIASGQWEVVGGWLVEQDANLPLSSSFINSAKISRDFMKEYLNTDTEIGYSPDTFGHPASLPELLHDTGFKYYIFTRPGDHEKTDLPSNLFYWEHNGKRILCYRLKYHYTSGWNSSKESYVERFNDESFYVNDLACYLFGMGDHGGGPTKEEIKTIKEIQAETKDIDIKFSTCEEFFKVAEKLDNIPVYKGDLHYHAIGCYSVNRNIKDGIRKSERSLELTERIYNNLGKNVDLEDLWEKTIFNEFHDIMPGSCSPEAATQSVNELGGIQDASEMLAYRALKTISQQIPIVCKQGEFRIYNSLPFPVSGPFEIESFMYFREGAPFKRNDGTVIDIQEIKASVDCVSRRWIFSDTIPAKSMASYYFDSDAPAFMKEDLYINWADGNKIEKNNIAINKDNNILINNKNITKSPLKLAVIKDSSDTWSHDIPGYNEGIEGYFELASSSISNDNICDSIITNWKYKNSTATFKFNIYKDFDYIDLDLNIRWNEDFKVLKLQFEDNNEVKSIIVQGAGAAIEKTTNKCEEPLHGWIKFNNLAICQNGAFAFDKQDNTVGITLVRSSLYGWHHPWKLNHKSPLNYTDVGEHKFKFRILNKENISVEEIERMSKIFFEPFQVLRENK